MSYLSVPGAKLYYEIAGTGPVLLLIAGGTDDGRDFAGMTQYLASAFTVVTYDCRGISRSSLDGPACEVPIPTHADDAHRLLREIGSEPAYVFGSSSGAQTALHLTARHPGQVRVLVAHEPPATRLLPEGDPRRDVVPRICSVYRSQGAGPAMLAFIEGAGLRTFRRPELDRPESPQAAAEVRRRLVRIAHNLDHFLANVIAPAAAYEPEVDSLRSGSVPVTVAVGEASKGQMAHSTALALADLLGVVPETFPGGHAGFVTHPVRFARQLKEILIRTRPVARDPSG